jgi:hypothetical protein
VVFRYGPFVDKLVFAQYAKVAKDANNHRNFVKKFFGLENLIFLLAVESDGQR